MTLLNEQFRQRDQEQAQRTRERGMQTLEAAREAERAEQAARLIRYQQQQAPVDLAAGILDPQPEPAPTAPTPPAYEPYTDTLALEVWARIDALEAQKARLLAALQAATPPQRQQVQQVLDDTCTQLAQAEGQLERLHADRAATMERQREQVRRSTPENSYGILA